MTDDRRIPLSAGNKVGLRGLERYEDDGAVPAQMSSVIFKQLVGIAGLAVSVTAIALLILL